MKIFTIGDQDFECEARFNFAAVDRDRSLYVYEEEPFLDTLEEVWQIPEEPSRGTYQSLGLIGDQSLTVHPGWTRSLMGLK